MKRTKIAELYASAESHIGKEVCVKGWVRTHRGNKYVQFVALNDGSTIKNLQVVFDMNNFTDEQLKPLTTGSAMSVTGLLVESQGKGQPETKPAAENGRAAQASRCTASEAGHKPQA